MRILFITPYVPSSVRIRPLGFIRELSKRHEITLVTLVHPSAEARFLHEVAPYCQVIYPVPLMKPEAWVRCLLSLPTGVPLSVAYTQSGSMQRLVRDLVRQGGFDLIHVEFARAAPLAAEIDRALREASAPCQRIARVYDAVDSMTLTSARAFRASHSLLRRAVAALEWVKFRRFEAWAIRQYDRVLISSPADRAALSDLAPEVSVAILPNGVDTEFFSPLNGDGLRAEPPTIAFLGRLSYHTNVTSVLHFYHHILPLIRARRPDVRLLLIGRDPVPAIQALAADPNVEVTGYVPDVRRHLARATVSVCPMRAGAGVSNKVLESMAMGLPVVSTSLATAALAVEHDRELLIADDPVDFADMVLALLSSARLRARLGKQARAYVEAHHRWPAIADQLEQHYQDIVGRDLSPIPSPHRGGERLAVDLHAERGIAG